MRIVAICNCGVHVVQAKNVLHCEQSEESYSTPPANRSRPQGIRPNGAFRPLHYIPKMHKIFSFWGRN